MNILELPLTSIEVGNDRARDLDPAWVEGLAGSIQMQGLMQPIVVRQQGDGYRLVAGLHRLNAFAALGRDTIPATLSDADTDDAAKLAEVMENLGRHDLIALDRCHHLYELKQVWERMYPDTKAGVAGGKARHGAATEIFSFAAATSERIGLSQRAIQIAVKIWTGIAPALRTRLRGTDLARKQTELKALSELPAAKQVKVLDAILSEDLPDVGNVAQAIEYLDGGVAIDPLEKRFQSVSRTFAALDETTFDNVLNAHEDRIIASLKRRGRI